MTTQANFFKLLFATTCFLISARNTSPASQPPIIILPPIFIRMSDGFFNKFLSPEEDNERCCDCKKDCDQPLCKKSVKCPTDDDIKYGNKVPIDVLSEEVKKQIVDIHNNYRSQVEPTATNMLKMSWHEGAARQAQSWASACGETPHDDSELRFQPLLRKCGQNAHKSIQRNTWNFSIERWFNEKDHFTYGAKYTGGKHPKGKKIGHYTQLVWATSHRIGCGLAYCGTGYKGTPKPYYNYYCNYCPGGNRYFIEDITYKPYESGPTCERCRDSCSKEGLCTNSCPYVDEFSNCATLKDPCNNSPDELGYTCEATCKCQGRIY